MGYKVQDSGCDVPSCAEQREVLLNASSLTYNSSLRLTLVTEFANPAPDTDEHSTIILQFLTLLDSRSTDCFIDSRFVHSHDIPVTSIDPLNLWLFDGSLSPTPITSVASLPVSFPSRNTLRLDFYVTTLDSSCKAVLGYNFLHRYNPLVDWLIGKLTFPSLANAPVSPQTSALAPASPNQGHPSAPPVTPRQPSPKKFTKPRSRSRSRPLSEKFPFEPIYSYPTVSQMASKLESPEVDIALLGAQAFSNVCRLEGCEPILFYANHTVHARSTAKDAPCADDSPPSPVPPNLPPEYAKFADVFDKVKADTLAEHRPYDLKIDIEEGAEPPLARLYPLSPKELEALRKFLDENLANGFISPSNSPHGAPVLFAPKKNGALRLCVDFRGLSKITRKDRYPLPLLTDLLDAPGKAKIYTKIDLQHAFHLVRIAAGHEWKTTFRTRYGSFEWNVMPFGLTNAPAAFQRFINDVFGDILDRYVVVYMDDLLIYSDTPEEHREHVREILRRLRKHRLFANADKCEFGVSTVEFLGYILSPQGLRMSEEKIKVIVDWPVPRKVKDVQAFLGFANFYRRFIFRYSDITVPLTRLTQKNTTWNWSPECQAAFDFLKTAFTSAPILAHWEPNRPLIVETDASDYALAAILSIILTNGEIHPIAFLSRTFQAAELNYDTHDKELLAIFEAFKAWRHYLEGSGEPVDVVTDHKNLEYFATTKVLTRRQVRWSEYLHQFNMVICFRPGKLGEKPDALTRRWDIYPKEGDSVTVMPNTSKVLRNIAALFRTSRALSELPRTLANRGNNPMVVPFRSLASELVPGTCLTLIPWIFPAQPHFSLMCTHSGHFRTCTRLMIYLMLALCSTCYLPS